MRLIDIRQWVPPGPGPLPSLPRWRAQRRGRRRRRETPNALRRRGQDTVTASRRTAVVSLAGNAQQHTRAWDAPLRSSERHTRSQTAMTVRMTSWYVDLLAFLSGTFLVAHAPTKDERCAHPSSAVPRDKNQTYEAMQCKTSCLASSFERRGRGEHQTSGFADTEGVLHAMR